jgi:4-amino-4-deoxy-L-arabinose transferase-like glycosyltransferase
LIVFTSQIAGFVGELDNQNVFLLIQFVELCTFIFVWFKNGKPKLFDNLPQLSRENIKTLLFQSKKNFITSLFFLLVSFGYAVLLWLILNVPPNNSDSMHTHLARVMYWLQQGSFEQLTSSSIYAKIYPFNAQLNILWTILFSKSDNYVGFIQFFAAIICAVSIYGISRLLDGSIKNSIITSMIFLTFPIIIFQATTTQFDLVVTALFISSLFFFFDHYKRTNKFSIFFSGLSLGLAFGTKQTVFMVASALLIIVIIIIIKDKTSATWLLQWAAVGTMSFIILGSFPYFNNIYHFNNPFGPSEHVTGDSFGSHSVFDKFRYNSPRLFYQFISFDSLPTKFALRGNEIKNSIFQYIDFELDLELESLIAVKDPNKIFSLDSSPKWNEDESWFGLASVILLIPALIIGLFYGIFRKEIISLSLVLLSLSFFVFEILLRPGWDPYQGRYFILSIAIITPLGIKLINDKIISKIFTFLLGTIAIISMATAVFSNELKPILGVKTIELIYENLEENQNPDSNYQETYYKILYSGLNKIWTNLPFIKSIKLYDEIQLRSLSSLNLHENIVREVERIVPSDGRMGVMLGGGSYDYVFFGPKLERVLININPIGLLENREWVNNQKISHLLIYDYQRISIIPEFAILISHIDGWGLYSINIID